MNERIRKLAGLGAAAFFLGAFLQLGFLLRERSAAPALDRSILLAVAERFRTPGLNGLAVEVTALGAPAVLWIFTVFGAVLLGLKRDWRAVRYLIVGSWGASFLNSLSKHFFTRSRPDVVPRLVEVTGYSYPSGHSLGATAFYLLVAFLVSRELRTRSSRGTVFAMALLLIALVCFSRLYLGVHYPTDVVSGFFLGSAWALLLTALFSLRGKSGDL